MRLLQTLLMILPLPALAADLPACARSGAVSVMINGLPALRLGDVAACPSGFYSIVPGIRIEGQPMVRLNSGVGDCLAGASANVLVNGEGASRLGDAACPPR